MLNFIGVFALLQFVAVSNYLKNFLTKTEFKYFFFLASSIAAGIVFLTVVGLTWAGVIAGWSGR
jgi:dolichyl-diphosphooligosaccharide--protein glycosyltransferase